MSGHTNILAFTHEFIIRSFVCVFVCLCVCVCVQERERVYKEIAARSIENIMR